MLLKVIACAWTDTTCCNLGCTINKLQAFTLSFFCTIYSLYK